MFCYTENNNYAPKLDHTLQSNGGKYLMFQQPTNNALTSSYKIVSSVNMTFDKDHCLTLWYYEDGEVPFSFYMYMGVSNSLVTIRNFNSAIENRKRWNLLKADITYGAYYNVKSE